jgi:predicted transcriptional regulator
MPPTLVNSNSNTYSDKVRGIIDNIIFHQYPAYISSFLKAHLDVCMRGHHDFGGSHSFFIYNHFFILLHQQNQNSFANVSYDEFYQNSENKKYVLNNVNFASIAKALNLKYETFRRYRLELAQEGWFKFGSNTVEFTQKVIEKRKKRNELWLKSYAIYLQSMLKLIEKHFKITLSISDAKTIEETLKEHYEQCVLDFSIFTATFVSNWTKLFKSFEAYLVFQVIFLNQIRTIEYENDKQGLGLNFDTVQEHFYDIPPRFAMSATSIADSVGFPRTTITRHLAKLEKKNFVIRLGNLDNAGKAALTKGYPFLYNQKSADQLQGNISSITIETLGGKKSYLIKADAKAIGNRTKIREENYRMSIDFLAKQFIRLKLLSEDNLEQIATSQTRFLNPSPAYIKSETVSRK